MKLERLVTRLRELGVHLSKVDGRLHIKAPPGRLTSDLIQELQIYKAALLSLLPDDASHTADASSQEATGPGLNAACAAPPCVASTGQERLWFLHRLTGDNAYNVACVLKLAGRFDQELMAAAFRGLVERHEPLRTVFQERDGECHPRLLPSDKFALSVVHVAEAELHALVRAVVDEPFRLTDDLPIRATLFIHAPEQATLVVCVHHSAVDGRSLGILLDELRKLIACEPLPPLAIDYGKWVRAEREELETPEFKARLQWWADYLKNLPPLELPGDQVAGGVGGSRAAGHVSRRLSTSLPRQLSECAGRLQTTPFALFAATFGALLARYTGQSDLALGVPVANRGRPGAEQLVGLLSNTLVLRCRVANRQSFAGLVRQTTADIFEVLARQDVPLDQIASALQLPRSAAVNPLFQVMLVMQPALAFELPGAHALVELCPPATAKFDLTLMLLHSTDELAANLEYRADRFSEEFAQELLDRFVRLLGEAIKDTSNLLSDLPTLHEIEVHKPQAADSFARAGSQAGLSGTGESSATEHRPTHTYGGKKDKADVVTTGRLAELEQQIGEVWRELLGVERVRADDNFFALGGHSLLTMRLAARLSRRFGIELPVAAVFDAPGLRDLAARVAEATPSLTDQIPIAHSITLEAPHPLSFAQERLWTLEQIDRFGAGYNLGMAVRLSGDLNVNALGAAFDDVVRRHRILGARFHSYADGPLQFVPSEAQPQLEVLHVAADEVERHVAAALWSPFEINDSPLVRMRLLALTPDEHVLAICMHHAVSDGWSIAIFNRELSMAYAARRCGTAPVWPDLPIQYGDFAVWQRQEMANDAGHARDLAYWERHLAELPDICTLPLDFKRPEQPDHRGARISFELPTETAAGLRRLAQATGASPFMLLLAAFAVVASRFRGDGEVVVGSPFAGRTRPELEPLIGCFVNTLVLRTKVDAKASFAGLVSEVRATVLQAHAYQSVPFERIVDALKPFRTPGHSPLFQMLFAMDTPDSRELVLDGLQTRPLPSEALNAKYDLNIHFSEHGADAIKGYVEYAVELFEAATVERLIESLQWVLYQVTARPEQPVAELTILSARQQQELACVVKLRNVSDLPTKGLIHEQFAEQARRTPQVIALDTGTETVTYEALARRVNQLAHHLKSLGAGADIPVAVLMRRSIRRATALLGILTAGAPYLPLGLDFPVARKQQILRQAGASLLLVDDLNDAAALDFSGRVVNLSAVWAELETLPDQRPAVEATSDDLAYVMFTSGTTGKPKGVMVPHRGVAHDLCFLSKHLQLTVGHRVLQVTEYTFDPSVRDLFATLGCGATAVLMNDDEAQRPAAILHKLASERITHVVSLTPTMLRTSCATAAMAARPDTLQVLMLNGEPLTANDILLARERLGDKVRLFNQYGPTETTMTSCIHEVRTSDLKRPRIPVGPPNPNTRVVILDDALRAVPIGVFGEVFIGGIGVARGYLGDSQLTGQSFMRIPDQASGDALWYRTGDVGRWLSDGALDLCGRRDTQIKLRGNRVELAEIEECLLAHPHVRQAAVAVHCDRHGVEHLVAYVVFASDGGADTAAMRVHLGKLLPGFMIPSLYVALDRLPRLSNGKLNRSRLPVPTIELLVAGHRTVSLPTTQTERAVAALWRQVLPYLSELDRHANFFDVGGNSLSLIRLHQLVNTSFGRDDPVVALFRHPTIAAYAAFLDGGSATGPLMREGDADRIAKRRRRQMVSADPVNSF